jgi:acetyl-CoA carboxylase biotin carboxylase subunit
VRFADEAVCIGPADPSKSYLHVPAIIAAAEITGADAIHPGYGFLSENAEFAEICAKCGSPSSARRPEAMRAWGDKVTPARTREVRPAPPARQPACSATPSTRVAEARRIGFPVILKASGGGGGRGMRIVRSEDEVGRRLRDGDARGRAGFKNPDVYIERFVEEPKHIEFQVSPISTAGVDARRARVLAPAPPPEGHRGGAEPRHDRRARGDGRGHPPAIRETGYTSLGTLEFIMDEDGSSTSWR